MRLTREQYITLRDKLCRACGIHQPVVYENGTFEIYNIPEQDIYNVENKLQHLDIIADINKYKGRNDFNHLKFNQGFPEPSSYWNLRGFLKEPTEESLEDIKRLEKEEIEAADSYDKSIENADTEAEKELYSHIKAEEDEHLKELQDYEAGKEPDLEEDLEVKKDPNCTINQIVDYVSDKAKKYVGSNDKVFIGGLADTLIVVAKPTVSNAIEDLVIYNYCKDNNLDYKAEKKSKYATYYTFAQKQAVAVTWDDKKAVAEGLEEAVEIHDTLNPKIWDAEKKLIPEVRSKIIQIVERFKEYLTEDKVPLNIVDVYILGSNANYNYNDDSDLDLHIIVDESADCINKHLPLIYNAYKSMFNSKYEITIKGINVEIYVENKDQLTNASAGVYSLKNGWVKDPDHYEIPDIDQEAVTRGVDGWEKRYFQLTENGTLDQIDNYIDELYELRQESIKKDGEFGLGNLIFKEVRRLGYLDDLKELKNKLTAQELSLENLEQDK